MSYSQLLGLKKILNNEQYKSIENYIGSLSPNSKLSASNVAVSTLLDMKSTHEVLKFLVDEHILKYSFAIRCPECGLLLSTVESVSDVDREQYCYNCEERFEISSDDVEVIYAFDKYPFVEGRQKKIGSELEWSAAPKQNLLTQLLERGTLDLNAAFFSPTEEEYTDLQKLYSRIFDQQKNTKATGDTLELLTIKIFSLCKHFRAVPIRLRPNQIDCYVRNKLYIPGISQVGCLDSFEIECKNEKKTPKAGYLNKLHSILRISGKNFGIIVSKCPAPTSLISLSNQIFLSDKIIIVAFDKNDLRKIIFDKNNLLECLEKKIDAIKLNATQDLTELGLYDA